MGKKPIAFVTYKNDRISIKKQLTLHKMCVTPLLGTPWANLWPFMGCTVNGFLSTGWGLQRSGPTDPSKENDRKFAPTAPVASKFRLGNRRQFCFRFMILLQDAFAGLCTESESKVVNRCNLSRLEKSTEPWFELPVTFERQQHGPRLKLLCTLGVGYRQSCSR